MSTATPSEVSLAKPKEIWNTMPGWGIVANLTPHELIVARRIQSIRKYLAVALIALVLALGGLYGWAWTKSSAASSDLSSEQSRAAMLSAQQSKYGQVTRVQTSIDGINAHLSQLMSADVDMSSTVESLRIALPAGVTLDTITLTVSKASASTAAGSSASTLNTSGHLVIGNVTLNGKGKGLDAVASYVTALRKITGVTDVIPTSNSGAGGTFSITLALTDQVLSHRYDLKQGGSK